MPIIDDTKNIVRNKMCGGTNIAGTSVGKARKVGSRTVNVGMARIMLDLCGWNIVFISPVLTIIANAIKKKISSIIMFAGL